MNKKLKDKIDVTIKQNNVAKDMFIKKCDNCIKLQKKIDKAIEYLKDNACYENTISELFCDDLDNDSCMELLNILRGEDNEKI